MQSAMGFGMFIAIRYGTRARRSMRTRPATARRRSPTAPRRAASGAAGAQRRDGVVHRLVRHLHADRDDVLLTGSSIGARRSRSARPAPPPSGCFNTVMPGFGGYIVAFCVFLFGYGTLIGWAYYGEQFLEYSLGRRSSMPYRWIYCLLIPFGAVTKVDPGLGLGRPDERAADLPEPDRRARPERDRRKDRPRQALRRSVRNAGSLAVANRRCQPPFAA